MEVLEELWGGYLGFWSMVLRELIGNPVSSVVFGLDYLWALRAKDIPAWHDKIAGTGVLLRKR